MHRSLALHPAGKDLHRLYVIAYSGDSETLVLLSRDSSTLQAWLDRMFPGLGLSKPGIYFREKGKWVFVRTHGDEPNPAYRHNRRVRRAQPIDHAARQLIIDTLKSGAMRTKQIVTACLSEKPSLPVRSIYRHLRALEAAGVISREVGPRKVVYSLTSAPLPDTVHASQADFLSPPSRDSASA